MAKTEAPIKNRVDVINRIKGWITSGDLAPGTTMPTERELSVRLSTQRLTVHRALTTLEQEGIVRKIGHRTRIIAERSRTMEHTIIIINSAMYQRFLTLQHMSGWAVMMSVGAVSEVSESNYNLMLIHPDHITHAGLDKLLNGRPTGVVFPERTCNFPDKNLWLSKLKNAGIPLAVYGDDADLAPYDRVVADHQAGSYKLTHHLLSVGRRSPLMFYAVTEPHYWVKTRYAGYEQAMREAGLEPLPLVCIPPHHDLDSPNTPEAFDAVRRYMLSYLIDHIGPVSRKQKVDALLLATDGNLFSVSAACRSLGLKPGEDILLAGYDNYWSECCERKFEPIVPTATIDKRNVEAGKMLVRLVHARAAGQLPPEPQKRMVESELCIIPNPVAANS